VNPREVIEQRFGAAIVRKAWATVLDTTEGKIVAAVILEMCHHNEVTKDPEHRVLQQFAVEFLRESGLYQKKEGSLPVDYVSALMRTKIEAPVKPEAKPSLLGRLLRRNPNV
jgi:hypothetical protein